MNNKSLENICCLRLMHYFNVYQFHTKLDFFKLHPNLILHCLLYGILHIVAIIRDIYVMSYFIYFVSYFHNINFYNICCV